MSYWSNVCKKCGLHFHPRVGHPHDCNKPPKPVTFKFTPTTMIVVCKSCHHYSKVVGEDVEGRRMIKPSLFEFRGLPNTKGLKCACGRHNFIMINPEKY